MKKWHYISILCLAMIACREPFDFEYDEVAEGTVVIEGYLTDEAMEHRVRVTESSRIGDFNGVEPRYIEDATVTIVDDQGTSLSLTYRENGQYFTDETAVAVEGRHYKVVVELADGRIFESSAESMPSGDTNPIELSYEQGEREYLVNGTVQTEDVLILTNTITKQPGDRYYMWEINEYFIEEADAGPGNELEDELLLPDTVPLRFCYVRDFPLPEIYVHKDIATGATANQQYDVFLQYVRVDNRWEHQYILMVRQLMVDVDAFTYWEQIGEFSNNSGSLFDPFPASIRGNIAHRNGTERALGYFGVYKTSFFRQEIRWIDLGISSMSFPPCEPSPRPGPQPCTDCRLYPYADNFNNKKPDWWD